MLSIQEQLSTIQVGDMIHGNYPSVGSSQLGSAICLVVQIAEDEIHTRAVTTQYAFVFNRTTGSGNGECQIDSIAPLPPQIHATLLDIDRRYRETPEDGRLSRREKDALLFVAEFYAANLLFGRREQQRGNSHDGQV